MATWVRTHLSRKKKSTGTNSGEELLVCAKLLAAFTALLKRYTDEDEIHVRFVYNDEQGQSNSDFQISFQIECKRDPVFSELTSTVFQHIQAGESSAEIKSDLSDPQSLISGIPLQVSFDLEKKPGISCTHSKLRFNVLSSNPGLTRNELTITLNNSSGRTIGRVEFVLDLDKELVQQVHDHFTNILEDATANPHKKISELQMLSEEEQHKILRDWNATEVTFPDGQCLHQLIEDQVERSPESTALIYKGEKLTYRELNDRANFVAGYLIQKGVKPEEIVGLCVDLSFEAVISVLGILKAGAAYLPLDTDYPSTRLQYIIDECQPKALIVQNNKKELLKFPSSHILLIDEEPFCSGRADRNPDTKVAPPHLAYVMYTSGSTGVPKGVLIQHDNVVNNIHLVKKRYELTEKDTVLSMPSLAFDASVSKLFPILTVGGAVVLPAEDEVRDIEKTIHLIHTYNVPYFATTPGILRVVNSINPDLTKLRVVTSGGETLRYSDIDNILRQVPVLNVYGPAEATVSSCSYKVAKGDVAPENLHNRVPIGRPNPNCRIYILDKHLNCVPAGCYGTLYIGGKGVGRGYLKNPKLTSEKFIENPFVPGDRLYNTGDIARWLPDGNIDFLGRKDNEVKIRGFRIALEEIEKTIASHPSVAGNKTIAKKEADGSTTLVAFLVPKTDEKIRTEEMRKYLSDFLPHYMIPSELIVIDRLPLNRNNKIDAQVLQEYFSERKDGQPPVYKNEIESELAAFWKRILNIPSIKPIDNFFHLGGHSLHVMQLKHFIRQRFNADVPIKSIFAHPTIELLSQQVIPSVSQENKPIQEPRDFLNINAVEEDTRLPVENTRPPNGLSHNHNRDKSLYKFAVQPELLPLSFGEERLWFLYQFQLNKSTYNVVKAWRITGTLNVETLERSLTQVILRHENLRKNFLEVDGEPKAKIISHPDFKIRKIDLNESANTEEAKKKLAERILNDEIESPFELTEALPIRSIVTKISENENLLILTVHHIIADAWSFDVLCRDLNLFYLSFNSGDSIVLPSLTDRYRKYPLAQRQSIDEILVNSLTFWKGRLNGKIERLKLPYDHPADGNSDAGAVEEIALPHKLVESIARLSREKDVTLFITFFAAFQALLFRYTKNENVVVATAVADRQEDTKELIGFFVNTLLFSTSFADDPDFVTVLENVRDEVLESYQHQNLPFEILANELRKETGIDANALIQVMFAFQNAPGNSIQLEGLNVEEVPIKTRFAKFDLTLSVSESREGYLVSAEYKTALFRASTIRRMLRYFQRLLEFVSQNPGRKVSQIDLMTSSEMEVILKEWNDTHRYIPESPVHELFERQVEATPESIALYYNEHPYTYDQLNTRANQLAHYLSRKKIQADEFIGILMEETDDAIVAMIAILKAGGAYLPLDPSYPQERIAYMLQNTKAKIVVTCDRFRNFIPQDDFEVILLDSEQSAIEKESKANLKNVNTLPFHLAYAMYTSGSTGKPKGAGIEHQSIVRLVKNINYVRLDENTRILKTGAFAFDASTFEAWGTLLNGGQLFLYPKENLLDPQFLKEKISENRVNLVWITSSWFNQLTDIDPSIFRPLQTLITGGDKVSAKHVNKVKKANPALEVINGYGPTENTTFSLFYKIEGEQREPIPIGKPISNTTVYILDDALNILPVGMEGEIYLGGKGVARGYLNDTNLTQEKFLHDPFDHGGRLYKTGDLGRWMENGSIYFCGRRDTQVKLRGYRIEPGEIEHTLNLHSAIEESVVLAVTGSNGDKQLISFYTGKWNVPETELNTFLRGKLPDYMVPLQFNWLENFPLNANGKIDKSALLNKVNVISAKRKQFEAPSNPVEANMLKIWEEVLEKKQISTNDSFFHLGGHSLLATRLMARIKTNFDQSLPVSLLFQAPTIKELSQVISKDINLKKSCLVPIQPKGNRTPFFVIPGYLFYYHLASYLGEDQPLYGFEPIAKKKTEEVAAFYINQMQLIQPVGPYFLGGYCAGGIVAYEMALQLRAAGHSIGLLALFEVYTPEGIVARTSSKYIREKTEFLKNNFKAASHREKIKLVYTELKKLFNNLRNLLTVPRVTYSIQPYDGRIILFKAKEGMIGSADNPYMGWNKYCRTEMLEVIDVPGNHDTMFKEPNVGEVAVHLKTVFKKAEVNARDSRTLHSS